MTKRLVIFDLQHSAAHPSVQTPHAGWDTGGRGWLNTEESAVRDWIGEALDTVLRTGIVATQFIDTGSISERHDRARMLARQHGGTLYLACHAHGGPPCFGYLPGDVVAHGAAHRLATSLANVEGCAQRDIEQLHPTHSGLRTLGSRTPGMISVLVDVPAHAGSALARGIVDVLR